ncbi:MAG: hypothetical protein GX455_00845 [Phycisphaerae bacterium]|nr:hypothetical protein [Phycisphaerae bacterium]
MDSNVSHRKTCRRLNTPNQAHELTFSCFHNQKFLSSPRTCQWLLESIDSARQKLDFSLWGYVFMPDHVHLLIRPRQKAYSISEILKRIKTPVAVRAIGYVKNNNPADLARLATGQTYRPYRFWQKGGGYDRNINRIDTLLESIRYIHNNPVRKGLVDHPGKWYYSSALEWKDPGKGPLRIDRSDWPVFV